MTCDIWYVTCDMWHVTCDMWPVRFDMWHVTCHMCHVACQIFFLEVLLSTEPTLLPVSHLHILVINFYIYQRACRCNKSWRNKLPCFQKYPCSFDMYINLYIYFLFLFTYTIQQSLVLFISRQFLICLKSDCAYEMCLFKKKVSIKTMN